MAVKNLKVITPFYWIPPIYTANSKMTVERSDGTIDDISDILMSWKIEDGVTSGVGIFEFTVPNPGEIYSNAWTGMEIFRYYCEYAGGVPTTLRFRGRIEKPSKQGNTVKVTGRSEALFVHDQSINKTYTGVDAGYIVKDLFDTYGQSRYDTSGINVNTGVLLTLTFGDTPFGDVLESVCTASGYDCYVDANLVVQFFLAGSQLNVDEAIVHENNLMEVGDFASDLSFIKNKIRVIGGIVDGVQIIYTANDTASQTAYGIRRETINDDGIITFTAAQDLAEYIKTEKKNPPITGEVKALLMATIQPGQNINISAPLDGIAPGNYRIVHYKLEGGDSGDYTTVTINKEPKRISHVIKDRIQRENKTTKASENPYDLDFSIVEFFDAFVGTLNNVTIASGALKVTTGYATGTWTSPVYRTIDGQNISKIRVSLNGTDLPNVRILLSTAGGAGTFEPDNNEYVAVSGGNAIVLQLVMTGTTAEVGSFKIQYSTT